MISWEVVRLRDGSIDPYSIRSRCGFYSVCKVGNPFVFEAWRTSKHPVGLARLGGFKTPEAAKACCEIDNP